MTVYSTIRPANVSDISAMVAIDKLASAKPWTERQFLPGCENDTGSEHTLLVQQVDLMQGFVVYATVLDEGSIYNVAVHPRAQRSGHARALLLAAFEAMIGRGVNKCLLEVRESNVIAKSLYASLGFQIDGSRKNYYRSADGREDASMMSILLEGGALNECP